MSNVVYLFSVVGSYTQSLCVLCNCLTTELSPSPWVLRQGLATWLKLALNLL